MNSLSWFSYLVDVSGNIQGLLVIAMIVAGLSLLIGTAYFHIETDKLWRWGWTRIPIGLFVASVLLVFIPSKNTMYAIAASEVGEKVVQSEAVQGITNDATKALQQWIKKQIEPETKGSK